MKSNRKLKLGIVYALALAGGLLVSAPVSLAATTNNGALAHQGGSIVVTFQDDAATLDPAVGYDWENWSIIKSIFDGLMGYVPGTTKLEPALAKSYDISDDGTVYTFTLRQGVVFQNGDPFRAKDVKFSMDRMMNPATQSPGTGFFMNIVGAKAVADGKAKSISGVKVLGPYKVQFHLEKPDAAFLQKMALNFAFIVSPKAVKKYGTAFATHPVGTGAFAVQKWERGRDLVLVANRHYWRPGVPKVDKITFRFGLSPLTAINQLKAGTVDIAGNSIPPAVFLQLTKSDWAKQHVVHGPQLETSYITLNTKMKPFDNVLVRRAVNMAINKKRIIQVINGRAVAANQVLPPLSAAYDKAYKGYAYDPTKAKALLAKAGYPDGFSTELYVYNTPPQPRIAQVIQANLAAIGVKVKIRSLAQASVLSTATSAKGAPMVWSGGMGWIADYPDPDDWYWPILSCKATSVGGWNWAKFCDESIEKEAAKADTLSKPEQHAERMKMWKDVFAKVMKAAPWVPVFNSELYTVRSTRMGGPDSYYIDPINIPINYKHVWVKQ